MQSFLEEIIHKTWQKYDSLEGLVFILPSIRAGTFLKHTIAKTSEKPIFLPEIYSIEGFIEKVSGLNLVKPVQQLFELYGAYQKTSYPNKDDFLTFSKWGRTLLQDINEIDRYVIDAKELFSSLSSIQQLNHWSLDTGKTQIMKEHLKFWDGLHELYNLFNSALLEKGLGHQGLLYRTAYLCLDEYIDAIGSQTHIFIGFNALNTAESQIIQKILSATKSEIYWDLDSYFLEDSMHDASHFIRYHLRKWPYFQKNSPKGIGSNYNSKKKIQIIGAPKNVAQAKYVGRILRELHETDLKGLKNTAVILSDETLLNPLLNSIPKEIERVNITMGYPLQKTSVASLFLQLLNLNIRKTQKGWYYQDILDLLSHPYVQKALEHHLDDPAISLPEEIKKKNWIYLDSDKMASILDTRKTIISYSFSDKAASPKGFVKSCLHIIELLKDNLQDSNDLLSLEYLYRFYNLFNQISELLAKYDFIKDLKSLQGLYQDLLSVENLDFKGEPLEGLQVMGMLESRNLDFENVIITSVNEGILPSGKSNNSFIPFDLKLYHGLPTYKEKDAVYTYHFYRLLQRAKQIFILYNTEPDVLEGGERSRLIAQLLTDEHKKGDILKKTATPLVIAPSKKVNAIEKDENLLNLIRDHAGRGFSPTSLSNYIRNPLDFYKRNLLGIDDRAEVEETVAVNTFGTIIHDTLEQIYAPCIGQYLSKEYLRSALLDVESSVRLNFANSYPGSDINTGKNLIAFNVMVRYINNFINLEIEQLKHHQVKIVALETKLEAQLDIVETGFPIVLKGKIDRIDEVDGTTRIIDYKTGTVSPSQVEIINWDELIEDYKYSKAFQLLCYTLLYQQKKPLNSFQAGIISFKNLGAGLLQFAVKDTRNSRKKEREITEKTMEAFTVQLKKLVMEICNPDVPFTEKEV
ncbi:PD-(D/E)XK nuclease family protein [Ulvibacterium sp.]|uniref:PD-(D/E)XK nuclease family protein n=1 Tax=Ulvibacterium sp. TaxID=2665914 RepID=UPI002617552B|nr:PD-(D/E)XK nuclease family protein [Ulvibacterium sp.]